MCNIVYSSICYASFCYSVLRDCVNMDNMIKYVFSQGTANNTVLWIDKLFPGRDSVFIFRLSLVVVLLLVQFLRG